MQNRKQGKQDELLHQPAQLQLLKSSIVAKPPYCQGTLALPDSDFTLFYGTEGNAHRINLSTASIVQLQHLADTCAPATFGVAGEDVHDETYRKAGKLDNKDFTIGFDVNRSSLVDVIRTELLVETSKKVKCEDLNIELYKLNVYGKDAFFKAHVDTPRSELMFGSLVIVFPTPHEGGALKLRAAAQQEGETMEWTFDSSALLAEQEQPTIAYVAFFSDTEHEVMPVTSGHRVTITYNLYYALDESSPAASQLAGVPHPISTNEQSFKDALRSVLQDQSFLPDGGNLMFGLRHQYPLATSYKLDMELIKKELINVIDSRNIINAVIARGKEAAKEAAKEALRALEPRLKASDGVMLRVLRECALDASLKVLYEARENQWSSAMSYVMADRVLYLPQTDEMIEESAADYLLSEGGELVQNAAVPVETQAEKSLFESEQSLFEPEQSLFEPEQSLFEPEQSLFESEQSLFESEPATLVFWVTDPPIVRSGKGFEKTIQTYGNEPALDVVYWRIWIFARVGPVGQRETAAQA